MIDRLSYKYRYQPRPVLLIRTSDITKAANQYRKNSRVKTLLRTFQLPLEELNCSNSAGLNHRPCAVPSAALHDVASGSHKKVHLPDSEPMNLKNATQHKPTFTTSHMCFAH
ncbi:hypothetical protein Zmor_012633 [Zophobas morio]|uniref:Uncharacterized protein n=1 Tax=Zophobas morio TaxID=2755281 RepID=A0AA38MEX0_9CUCU|nr:hypothetical protein Zmor_012633 [Zophobas morio]